MTLSFDDNPQLPFSGYQLDVKCGSHLSASPDLDAGAGSNPFFIADGRVSLTGPYKGAPFGVAAGVSACGRGVRPRHRGRACCDLREQADAKSRPVSDPFPTILKGIPLYARVTLPKTINAPMTVIDGGTLRGQVDFDLIDANSPISHMTTVFDDLPQLPLDDKPRSWSRRPTARDSRSAAPRPRSRAPRLLWPPGSG